MQHLDFGGATAIFAVLLLPFVGLSYVAHKSATRLPLGNGTRHILRVDGFAWTACLPLAPFICAPKRSLGVLHVCSGWIGSWRLVSLCLPLSLRVALQMRSKLSSPGRVAALSPYVSPGRLSFVLQAWSPGRIPSLVFLCPPCPPCLSSCLPQTEFFVLGSPVRVARLDMRMCRTGPGRTGFCRFPMCRSRLDGCLPPLSPFIILHIIRVQGRSRSDGALSLLVSLHMWADQVQL